MKAGSVSDEHFVKSQRQHVINTAAVHTLLMDQRSFQTFPANVETSAVLNF